MCDIMKLSLINYILYEDRGSTLR